MYYHTEIIKTISKLKNGELIAVNGGLNYFPFYQERDH